MSLSAVASRLKQRRHEVAERLGTIAPPSETRRPPPPEGRLGRDEQRARALREALEDLGPLFASFGRYLSSRLDLLTRRECAELETIVDRRAPSPPGAVATLVARELGERPEVRFHAFDPQPYASGFWFERHHAWLTAGVPVDVTIVHPDAHAIVAADLPLLSLVEPHLSIPHAAFEAAVDDFRLTLLRRLDLTQQAAAIIKLGDDARSNGLFDAPVCYRDACAPGVLTLARIEGLTLADVIEDAAFDREVVARRLCAAWLRQAVAGRVVPFELDPAAVRLRGDRLVIVDAAFEPHTSDARLRFLSYVSAAAADDPDTASAWIIAEAQRQGVPADAGSEDELLRRLRQAVPFRDGEWSGDDRLAEHLLVHWRAARAAGWVLQAHQTHLYRGLQAVTRYTDRLAPGQDLLAAALQDERLRIGLAEAQQLIDPRQLPVMLDKMLATVINLPQKLDDVLTLAAEGRLRMKLNVPQGEHERRIRNTTVSLLSTLAVVIGAAFLARHLAPAAGVAAERLAAVLLLIAGAWLLRAAATL